ncbi:unnamed protein product [Closterium sp. NIES-54]
MTRATWQKEKEEEQAGRRATRRLSQQTDREGGGGSKARRTSGGRGGKRAARGKRPRRGEEDPDDAEEEDEGDAGDEEEEADEEEDAEEEEDEEDAEEEDADVGEEEIDEHDDEEDKEEEGEEDEEGGEEDEEEEEDVAALHASPVWGRAVSPLAGPSRGQGPSTSANPFPELPFSRHRDSVRAHRTTAEDVDPLGQKGDSSHPFPLLLGALGESAEHEQFVTREEFQELQSEMYAMFAQLGLRRGAPASYAGGSAVVPMNEKWALNWHFDKATGTPFSNPLFAYAFKLSFKRGGVVFTKFKSRMVAWGLFSAAIDAVAEPSAALAAATSAAATAVAAATIAMSTWQSSRGSTGNSLGGITSTRGSSRAAPLLRAAPPCRAAPPGTEPRRPAETRRPTEPRRPAETRLPTEPYCPARADLAATAEFAATAATAATAAMASPNVLTFDPEGRAVDFDVWVDDRQLFLQCDSKDGVSLFDHTSGVSPAPTATANNTVCSQWTTRDAVARLAVRSHLPSSERAHFGQDHFLSLCPTELVVDLLEERLTAAEKSIVAVGASCGDPRAPFFEGCSPVPLLPSVASAAVPSVSPPTDPSFPTTCTPHPQEPCLESPFASRHRPQ